MARILKPTHPLAIKIEKLFAFLEENDISIEREPYSGLAIGDNKSGLTVSLRDLEDSTVGIESLPPAFEFKSVVQEED